MDSVFGIGVSTSIIQEVPDSIPGYTLAFFVPIRYHYITLLAKGDWDFRISDLVKTLMELIFNACGEFR